jgi:hypothetical protein
MKVFVETKITPIMTVYDSSAPATQGGIGKAIRSALSPVVAVTDDDGNVLYQSGDFYPSLFPYVAIGVALLLILVIGRLTR